MADINIYGTLNNATPEGTLGRANQIKDTRLNKNQEDINKEFEENKQDNLVSGSNIKTINGQSLLGSGDMLIELSGSEDNSIVDVSSIVSLIMDENTITPEDYNSLKEYITQGKTLLFVEDLNVTTLYSFLSNNVITIGYYALSPDDDKVTSVYISIDNERLINPYTLTFPSTKIIPQVLLTDYVSGSTYSTINTADSINSAIGKLEAGIKSLTTNSYGDTESRPSNNITVGYKYFDTTLNKPMWWNGTKWVDSNGLNADNTGWSLIE